MKSYLIYIFLFLSFETFSQHNSSGRIWFRPTDDLKPIQFKSDGKFTKDEKINGVFLKWNVTEYKQALPFAKNLKLKELYEITFNGNEDSLLIELLNDERLMDVRKIELPTPSYDPTDYMWYLIGEEGFSWLWHLKAIQSDIAWDITKGNPDVKIAIIDTDFDLTHPDLSGQFDVRYDPYTNIFHSVIGPSHGTAVASYAAAKTDGGGQLASIGFNSKIIGYTWDNGLAKALHASNVMGADIISISWHYGYLCSPDPDDALIINEILDNGTIIVAAAGNGPADCGGGEIYPFASVYDDRLIKVSSTDKYDKHQYIVDGSDRTHSHYPGVDICAPGYCEMGAISTIDSAGNPVSWPYYGCESGTSFATPIVAGVCALMKSINPCLTPDEAQTIIKATADPITDAYLFPGLVGAGRINAYNSVKMAGTRNYINTSLSGNQNLSAGYGFNFTNVTIGSNSNISVSARKEVNLNGTFEVPLGSSFSIEMGENVQTNCP